LLGGWHDELNHVFAHVYDFFSLGRFCHRFVVLAFVDFDQLIGDDIEEPFNIFCLFAANEGNFVIFDIVVHSHPHRLAAFRFYILVPCSSLETKLHCGLLSIDLDIEVVVLHFDLYL
jgi:hypothetical protein